MRVQETGCHMWPPQILIYLNLFPTVCTSPINASLREGRIDTMQADPLQMWRTHFLNAILSFSFTRVPSSRCMQSHTSFNSGSFLWVIRWEFFLQSSHLPCQMRKNADYLLRALLILDYGGDLPGPDMFGIGSVLNDMQEKIWSKFWHGLSFHGWSLIDVFWIL